LVNPPAWGANNVLGISVVCPDDGRDYQFVIDASCSYLAGSGEAGGFILVEEDGAGGGPTDRDWQYCSGTGVHRNASNVHLHYVRESPTNGETYYFYVEFVSTTIAAADFHVNPTDNVSNFPNITAANWAGATSWSRIHLTVMPHTGDPTVAANYTVDS
jgi:hypothetical protein